MLKTIFIFFLALMFVGCASYRAYEKDVSRPAHQHVKKKNLKGLVIAAEDYSSPEKSSRFFDRDLRDYDYLPVYLSFANNSEYEFTIRKENISFFYEDGSEAIIATTEEVIEDTKSSYARTLLGIPLLIFPAFIIGSSVSGANYELKKDYDAKSLQDFNIVKDEKIFGFVFFKIPAGKREASLQDAILKVKTIKKAKESQMAETLEAILSLSTN